MQTQQYRFFLTGSNNADTTHAHAFSRVGPTWTVTRSCLSDSLSVSVTRHFAAESRSSMSLSNGCSGYCLQLKKFNANF